MAGLPWRYHLRGGRFRLWEHSAPLGQYWYAGMPREVNDLASFKRHSRSAPDEPLYSIRIADKPGTVCAACRKQETGAGPVGYMDDEPICDLCLLERSTDLATIAVVRAHAGIVGTAEQKGEAVVFIPIYRRVAVAGSDLPSSKFHGPRPYHAHRLCTYSWTPATAPSEAL